MGWTVRVLVETTKTNKVVITEKFNFFSCFFHLDIFRCEGMDAENLAETKYQPCTAVAHTIRMSDLAKQFHLLICRTLYIEPPSIAFKTATTNMSIPILGIIPSRILGVATEVSSIVVVTLPIWPILSETFVAIWTDWCGCGNNCRWIVRVPSR